MTEVVFRIKQQVFQYYSVYPPDVCVGNLCVSSDELSERGKVWEEFPLWEYGGRLEEEGGRGVVDMQKA